MDLSSTVLIIGGHAVTLLNALLAAAATGFAAALWLTRQAGHGRMR